MNTSIGTGAHFVLTMEVSFTGELGRLYRLATSIRVQNGTSAGSFIGTIRDGAGTQLNRFADRSAIAAAAVERMGGETEWQPGAGAFAARTYVQFGANANNAAGGSGVDDTGWLLVEDVGGVLV